ncbi:hypothetical protein NAT51_13645 [Flavobacterium amniphilum]|uniref:hypothetical protein n=1 Tax=Flavobacterium amniphilum TaxID=1834035 RepID=UPI002029DF85|nr:hypothetical protein [Flavobacterium amniphilum]MCL9806574.1 hypothetical protein [Flavobacterium amniphilum]
MKIPNKRTLLNTKNLFTISIIVITLTILSVWIHGLGKHRTVIENSLLSTLILSVAFFLFISINLFNGTKLKDNLGKINDNFDTSNLKKSTSIGDLPDLDFGDADEGIFGVILSIILWIIVMILISYLFFILGTVIWFSVLTFLGMLYWVFFRALRLIFKKSPSCNGNLGKSLAYGITYTFLYSSWIYIIIALAGSYAE